MQLTSLSNNEHLNAATVKLPYLVSMFIVQCMAVTQICDSLIFVKIQFFVQELGARYFLGFPAKSFVIMLFFSSMTFLSDGYVIIFLIFF